MARRQKDNLLSWLIIAVIAAFVISAFRDHDVLKIALIVSIGLMIISWFFAMQIPNRCGMATVKDGHPCTYKSHGVIFGCKQYHYTKKAKARFGMREQVWEQPPARGRRRKRRDPGLEKPDDTTDKPMPVEIVENAKSRITFRCMILTTACTLLTTGLTVATAVI